MSTMAVNNLREELNSYVGPEDTYCVSELVARDLLTVELWTPEYRRWLYRMQARCSL